MKGVLNFLQTEITTPVNYGWFHLMFIAIAIVAAVLLVKFFKNADDKVFRRIALISWIVMVVLELYKQFVFSFKIVGEEIVFDYQWYAFPFQFCSTPLYLLPLVVFLKDGKVRDCVIAYLSTFALFAGLVVYAYPNDVFIDTLGVDIQTMVHHGLQVVLGVYFSIYNKDKLGLKYLIKAVYVFLVMSAVAFILNEIVYAVFQAKGIDETFDMFFLSRHFQTTLPVLSMLDEYHFLLFTVGYVVGFSLAAGVVTYAVIGISKLVDLVVRKFKDDKLCEQ